MKNILIGICALGSTLSFANEPQSVWLRMGGATTLENYQDYPVYSRIAYARSLMILEQCGLHPISSRETANVQIDIAYTGSYDSKSAATHFIERDLFDNILRIETAVTHIGRFRHALEFFGTPKQDSINFKKALIKWGLCSSEHK